MALPSAPAVSRCSSPSSVPSAAGRAAEAAQAPVARAQIVGKSTVTQGSVPVLWSSTTSATLSSAKEVIGRKTAAAGRSLSSRFQVVSHTGEYSTNGSNHIILGGARQSADPAADAGVSGTSEAGVRLQSCTDTAIPLSRGGTDNRTHRLLHANAAPAGAALLSAHRRCEVVKPEATRADEGHLAHRRESENFILQSVPSSACFDCTADAAVEVAANDDNVNLCTEGTDFCTEGVGSSAPDVISRLAKDVNVGSAATRSQDSLAPAADNKDVESATLDKGANPAEGKARRGACNTRDTNSSAILMCDSRSTSPRTPSTAPSAEPSPALCLSQPSPEMLIRPGQAALPPPVTECCFKGETNSNNSTTKSDEVGDTHSNKGEEHPRVCEKEEEQALSKCGDDRKKPQQQYEGNARDGEVEKAASTWDRGGIKSGADSAVPFASPSTAAGGLSAAGNTSKKQIVEVKVAPSNPADARGDVTDAFQHGEQGVCATPGAAFERRSDTSGQAVTTVACQEAEACGARGAAMQDEAAAAAEDKCVRMSCQSPSGTEQIEAELNNRQVPASDGIATTQRPVTARESSEPLSLEQREDGGNDGTHIESTPEEPLENPAGARSLEEESGENSRFMGAASFLQKLQQQWETDADSHCHSLLSQLSIPLPAREKLLQNFAPSVRNSRGAEEVEASSSLATAAAARPVSQTPLSTSTAGAMPSASTARSNSSSIKDTTSDGNLAAGQGPGGHVAAHSVEQGTPRGQASPVRQSSAALPSGVSGRRGMQQQQLETLFRGRIDATAGRSCGGSHDCHDVFSCGMMTRAAARAHIREAGARAGRVRDTLAGADTPSGEASSDLVAAAAAHVLQQQLRRHLQQLHHPEAHFQELHPNERQQHTHAPENWTGRGAAAALEAVLSESSTFAGEGRGAADEESVNIRRWFESFGIAGRRAETAVAAVVKRAVDLQRRLATLLTVTLRQQLNQRLLVLALAILLEKHRREPLRCEEMLREQQRLLRVLETQQQQALADLPHLYGDLPEAQQLQQQLQQLREAEWQLRTGGDCFGAAQTAAATAAEQRPYQRVNRAAELGAFSSSQDHRLATNCTRTARAPAAAPAAVEGSTHVFHLSSSTPGTSAVAEAGGARWTFSKQNQADRNGRMTNTESRPDTPLMSITAGTPGGAALTAARSTPLRAKYLEDLTSSSAAEAVTVCSGETETRSDPATATELRAPRRHSRQAKSNSAWEDSGPLSEEKQASESDAAARPQAQQPMVERFLAKQMERRLATSIGNTQTATPATSGPSKATPAAGMPETASAAAGTAKESWRTGSGGGDFEDNEATAARGRPTRSITSPATGGSPPPVSAGNNSSRPDALLEQCDRGLSGRAAAASEGGKPLPSGTGRSSAGATVLRGAAAAGIDACSSSPVETAADGAAAHSLKGHPLPVTRSQAMPLQGSPTEGSTAASASSFASGSASDTAVSGSFTSVYSRGSNARHQNDPYPHNVMIQLIQPLPTGIKLELKSQRPASLGSAHGVNSLAGSGSSISSLSAASVELPAPREYALRVSLTRHETKYCSFHSLHGILPAYNEAVRLRNKFAGLPFVLPTMTLQELHQRKEQLDAGRPLPGHGPHEAFMTVQERITYYKQTGMSNSNLAKVENTPNASLGTSSTSVCYSPRSASPTAAVAPAAGRSSQISSPVASGAATAGNNSAGKTRSFRSSTASNPSGVADINAAAPAETDGQEGSRPGIRRVSGEDEHQQRDQMKGCVGRGAYSSGVKRGRASSVLGSGQQEDRITWPSTSSHAVTVQHQQQDGTRAETTSKSVHVSKPVARGYKVPTSVTTRPTEEGTELGASQDGKMQLRSRTTSSSGSRSEGTTISTITETGVKELTGAVEYRNRGDKRRKTGNESDDATQCFLDRGCFSKSSVSDPDEGASSSSQANGSGGYSLIGGDASAARTLLPGAHSDRHLAGSMARDGSGGDLKRILARNGGTRRGGSGGPGDARCPWEELLCWESPPYTQQSPGETTAVEGQSVVDSGLPTAGDVELLTQELGTDGALSSLLGEEVLKEQRGGSKQSPQRTVAAFMSSKRGTVVEEDWLPYLHGDRGSSDGRGGLGAGESGEEARRPQLRELGVFPAGASSGSACRKIDDGEACALLEMAATNVRRESASAEGREDNSDVKAPDTYARRNSNSAPAHKAGTVKDCVQDADWVEGNTMITEQELEGPQHT